MKLRTFLEVFLTIFEKFFQIDNKLNTISTINDYGFRKYRPVRGAFRGAIHRARVHDHLTLVQKNCNECGQRHGE